MTEQEAETCQQWQGMVGATAWHLIERHADGWEDIAMMMDAWLKANTPKKNPTSVRIGSLCEEKADVLRKNVGDLASLVAQLVRALRKAAPEHELPARAMDYLQRERLCGSPLRESLSNEGFGGTLRRNSDGK